MGTLSWVGALSWDYSILFFNTTLLEIVFFFIASTCVKWCMILSIIQPSKQLICETFVGCVSGIRWLKWVLFSAIPYYQLLANTKALESRWHPLVIKGDWVANMESRWHPLVTKGNWVENTNFGVEMAPLGYQGRLGYISEIFFLLCRASDDLFGPSAVSVTSPLHHHGSWRRTSSSDSDGVPASPTKTTAGVWV